MVNDLKEFLKEKKEAKDWGKTHIMDVSKEDDFLNRDLIYEDSIKVEDLQEFFLGEVARLKEDVCDKWEEYNNCSETELIGKLWIEAHRLEERLLIYKELAGVEQKC